MKRLAAPAPRRDLTTGLPDPDLLPALAPALARVDLPTRLKLSEDEPVDPELRELAVAWFTADGVPAEAIAVAGGALDGIERVLQAHLAPGDRVAIEDPAYPPFRDILLTLGLTIVPFAVDDRGPVPAALAAALDRGVDAVLLVPRAQNPFGSAIDRGRAALLQDSFARHKGVLIVEDDHAGPVAGAPYASAIPSDWPRWAVVRSVSKVLHPDLRLALIAGDETTVARVEGRQALGPGWVSRLLQALTAKLLEDPAFASMAARAQDTYAARREALIAALAIEGVQAHGRTGMNVWIPVQEEWQMLGSLLDRGLLVSAGDRFRIATPPAIRVTTASLRESEASEIARTIASAAQTRRSNRAY
ncbi:MAG: aminotransferase class I/II-fold pyridoxal phosphate-dependent enzyme [Actinomycetota bacterium]|nr:aminotransferase class I/II-fold pyridoxal phosphate-dependent enzyme [Actinomycetota bacterium]